MQIGAVKKKKKPSEWEREEKFNSLLSRSKYQNNKFPCFPISRACGPFLLFLIPIKKANVHARPA